jgi:ribonucleoside-diphosphate reductase alpha chain
MKEQQISIDCLQEKYCKNGETTKEEIFRRVSEALASVEKDPAEWQPKFYQAMLDGFIPAGRVMSAAGSGIKATLINCFVQPVGDAVIGPDKDGRIGIYDALAEAAETMRRGGGVGYNFSHIRPKGARVGGTESHASGPISYMRVFDRSCETVESAGARRGAQMGILRVDHPDIEDFIHAKDTAGELNNFNLSVGVTDDFMRAVEQDLPWRAEHTGIVKEWKSARDLWDQIMRGTYDHAEPGIVFLDTINNKNNLAGFETIEATNPCGEQPLPDYGCCCLGSIDLTRFVSCPFDEDGYASRFDFDKFASVVRVAVRMLDNVLDLTYWPLPQQKAEAMAKRRIGLGFTGLGDALIMLGLRYDTQEAREMAKEITSCMKDNAYFASNKIAYEKGAPDVCDASNIHRRNSHLLSIAPTGTISLAFADNASNGIEPPFSWTYDRKKRLAEGGHAIYAVEDHAYRLYKSMFGKEPPIGEGPWITALDISADDHMKMMEAVQPYVDSAISKTVNVPADYPYEAFQDLYMKAWKAGLKGLATYRPNAILGSVLSVPSTEPKKEDAQAIQEVAPVVETTDAAVPMRFEKRPRSNSGHESHTYYVDHPAGNFAITLSHIQGDPRPFEVWVTGAYASPALAAMAKGLSLDMRVADPTWIARKIDQLRDYPENNGAFWAQAPGKDKKRNYPSAIAYFADVLCYHLHVRGLVTADCKPVHTVEPVKPAILHGKRCKECGGTVVKRDGCEQCTDCGAIGSCG